jgi:anaerobic dimethyl sulfoxide reductase subunit A
MLTENARTAAVGEGEAPPGVNRRVFLKWSGVVGGSLALVSTATKVGLSARTGEAETPTEIVWSACTVNCGSRCPPGSGEGRTIVRVLADAPVLTCSAIAGACLRADPPSRLQRSPQEADEAQGRPSGARQWRPSPEQALDEIVEKMTDIKSRFATRRCTTTAPAPRVGDGRRGRAHPFARLLNGAAPITSDYSTTGSTAYQQFYGTWWQQLDDAERPAAGHVREQPLGPGCRAAG